MEIRNTVVPKDNQGYRLVTKSDKISPGTIVGKGLSNLALDDLSE